MDGDATLTGTTPALECCEPSVVSDGGKHPSVQRCAVDQPERPIGEFAANGVSAPSRGVPRVADLVDRLPIGPRLRWSSGEQSEGIREPALPCGRRHAYRSPERFGVLGNVYHIQPN
jgi:hypothetical protein